MTSLNGLVEKYGSPDILIDSFNKKSKRYAVWGFDEILELTNKGLFLNNKLINEEKNQYIQNIINKWKNDSNQSEIACLGFLSYEFKNYIYTHIKFKHNLNDDFPYLWFCKPNMIKEYDVDIQAYTSNPSDHLILEQDILDLDQYTKQIDLIKSYLKNGDVYQINFTDLKIIKSTFNNSFDLFNALRLLSKPEAGFFLKTDKFDILSFSPELFLKLENGIIETAPIKGTRPSSPNKAINQQLKNELKSSIKDKAEHLMIVDLLRNDLGKICDIGSIKIDKLYNVQTFETIHHMVTKIKGKLKNNISEFDIFKALFPGGSITGAPKASAMKIIDLIESKPRKIYTGSAGYITSNGDMCLNICIRTLLNINGKYQYGVGGGIIWDSIANQEWNEAHQKSRILEPLL